MGRVRAGRRRGDPAGSCYSWAHALYCAAMQHFDQLPLDRSGFLGAENIARVRPGRRIWRSGGLLPTHRVQKSVAILLLATAALLMLSYWPGIMTWDPIEQYDQAVQNQYADWPPPIRMLSGGTSRRAILASRINPQTTSTVTFRKPLRAHSSA